MKRYSFLHSILILGSAFLTGCNSGTSEIDNSLISESVTDESTEEASEASLQNETNDILLLSFIDSLEDVRIEASRLLGEARYRIQDTVDEYYIDVDGSGHFEVAHDIGINGSPIEHAGVHFAHAAGLTGNGEVIAISDSGFFVDHEALLGKTLTLGPGVSVEDHGTFVASVAVGNSQDFTGVAPEADLILGSFDSFDQLRITAEEAVKQGAVAINNSWGFADLGATTSHYDALLSDFGFSKYVEALHQFAEDGIVVFALPNNDGSPHTGLMPSLPLVEPSLESSWLAVANGIPVMHEDDIVSAQLISSGCREAAAWCLSANGNWTGATAVDVDNFVFGTGTSYSAPMVAGALALLAEAFPELSHQDLRIRLLASADNSFSGFVSSGSVELVSGFEHEFSDEWGHGFLNVAAALLPIGDTQISLSNGATMRVDEPLVVAGGASGDAIAKGLDEVNILGRDALNAPFEIVGASLVAKRSPAPLFSSREIENFDGFEDISYLGEAFFGPGTSIPFLWGGSDYNFSYHNRRKVGADAFGFSIAKTMNLGEGSMQLVAGAGNDTSGLLSDWNGGTDTAILMTGFKLSSRLSESTNVEFEAGLAFGRERSKFGQSAKVSMNSAALSISQSNNFSRGDNLKMSFALPVAVTSGETSIVLPFSSSSKAYNKVDVDLKPQQRELRLSLTYEKPISKSHNMGVSLMVAKNRGHVARAEELGALFGVNYNF